MRCTLQAHIRINIQSLDQVSLTPSYQNVRAKIPLAGPYSLEYYRIVLSACCTTSSTEPQPTKHINTVSSSSEHDKSAIRSMASIAFPDRISIRGRVVGNSTRIRRSGRPKRQSRLASRHPRHKEENWRRRQGGRDFVNLNS